MENINKQKRQAFSTKNARNEAQRRYTAKNSEKRQYYNTKSSAKRFILDFATSEDLEFLKNLIEERQKQ